MVGTRMRSRVNMSEISLPDGASEQRQIKRLFSFNFGRDDIPRGSTSVRTNTLCSWT